MSQVLLCPICKGEVAPLASNKFYPFCCKKCQNKDLGNWVFENYKVGGEEVTSNKESTGDE